jgi:hypothetical protein
VSFHSSFQTAQETRSVTSTSRSRGRRSSTPGSSRRTRR